MLIFGIFYSRGIRRPRSKNIKNIKINCKLIFGSRLLCFAASAKKKPLPNTSNYTVPRMSTWIWHRLYAVRNTWTSRKLIMQLLKNPLLSSMTYKQKWFSKIPRGTFYAKIISANYSTGFGLRVERHFLKRRTAKKIWVLLVLMGLVRWSEVRWGMWVEWRIF